MAKIRLQDNKYVPKNYESGQSFTPAPWALAGTFRPEQALRISAEIRAMGQEATAIQNSGGESLEPHAEAPPVQVSEEINWTDGDGHPIPWRIKTTRIPTPDGTPKYIYIFKDADSDTTHSIVGKSPQEVIDRLLIDHPVYTKHLAALPAALPQAEIQPASAPQIAEPTAPAPAVRRTLRPGSQTWDERVVPLQRISVPTRESVAVRTAQSYADWYKTASAAEYKARLKTDPAFLAWADAEN